MFDAALCPRMVNEGEAEDTYVAADFEKILEHFDAFFAEAHFNDVCVGSVFDLSGEEVF